MKWIWDEVSIVFLLFVYMADVTYSVKWHFMTQFDTLACL